MAIRVLHVGLGPIGVGVVRQCASRKGFKIVGAVDLDPAKIGKDLGEVADLGRSLEVKVDGKLGAAIKAGNGKAELTTVEGAKLTATVSGDTVTLTDAKGGTASVTQADVTQSNGVIHVIDAVLLH